MRTKNILLLTTFLGFIIIISCKKEYTCGCVQIVTVPAYTYGGEVHPQQVTINSFSNTFKSKKKDAESGCKQGESFNSYPSTYADQGQGPTTEIVTCELQ